MSVTFRPEPNPLSQLVLDHHIDCVAVPRRDRRSFGSYRDAVAGLADHHLLCGDVFCYPDGPVVVTRTAGDDEPQLNLSNTGAALVLCALGLRRGLNGDDVTELTNGTALTDVVLADPDPAAFFGVGGPDLTGDADAGELIGRIELALALSPPDEGVPWHTHTAIHNRGAHGPEADADAGAGHFVDCGRSPGYLQDRLLTLRGVAVYARTARRRVTWS